LKKPTKQQQNHWDTELQKYGLGMSRADGSGATKNTHGRRRTLFVGGLNELETIESQEMVRKQGRVKFKKKD